MMMTGYKNPVDALNTTCLLAEIDRASSDDGSNGDTRPCVYREPADNSVLLLAAVSAQLLHKLHVVQNVTARVNTVTKNTST